VELKIKKKLYMSYIQLEIRQYFFLKPRIFFAAKEVCKN
jgi:hypothetical protein